MTNNITLAQKTHKELAIIAGGFLYLAICSKISFFLPFSPIPVTLQTFGVLTLAGLMGRRSVYVLASFILAGLAGLPVFNALPLSAGYLVGFVLSAAFIGELVDRKLLDTKLKLTIAFTLGTAIILTMGSLWLANFTDHAFKIGFYPFIYAGAFKIALATMVVSKLGKKIKF
ncbi:MAG: biotin transporter BioY [Elusimicrobiaceae bacterium]|nr:biotin transporter BioY [Elusimicrobiaceae bacterium]MBT3955090.1 biotin transporter BioY [Elusimicrobiaceae bacterium]MBT4008232.1 biotin transporter BioY [Elusimicrobiaceae bacterium]MBT4402819.1 biotin transporter BioY [Elusimicrobiaceae bacterium]MBT4440066.1 biotin transporter BioY [Elusimicrobiaceae bacterium]